MHAIITSILNDTPHIIEYLNSAHTILHITYLTCIANRSEYHTYVLSIAVLLECTNMSQRTTTFIY